MAVIGAGRVGLTTAAYLAHLGHRVVCADADEALVGSLRRGRIGFVEAGLEDLVREGSHGGRLSFVVGARNAVRGAEFVLLCLPTPQGGDDRADMSAIVEVAADIGPLLEPESVVVNKSTVPVGSVRLVQQALGRDDVYVVSNPEFLREGSAVHDSLHPDRIVIGADDAAVAIRVAALFEKIDAPLLVTDPASAETIKYASNAFLAAKVSFINAVAMLCEAVGADVREVALGMGYDPRIGFEFLRPGPGWGGSCFPKDTRALVRMAEDNGYDFALVRGVIEVNEEQHRRVAAKVERLAGGALAGVTVGVWGLTFKARTDDLRESPSLRVIELLRRKQATVQAYDPTRRQPLDGVTVCGDAYAAAAGAAVLVVLTEWDEFRWVDLDKVRSVMARPAIVDARNLLDPAAARRAGFAYEGLGRL